jgi:hypothetical protein
MSKRGRVCECGLPKVPGEEACVRCMALDGGNVPESALVNALRNLGGDATSEAIMVEVGCSYRHLRRTAARLERSGRIIRIETGEERHANQPILMLDSAGERRPRWAQLHLPRFSGWLEESREGAGSQVSIQPRRSDRRRVRARMVQLDLAFRKRRAAREVCA